jgi:hypothetical protein
MSQKEAIAAVRRAGDKVRRRESSLEEARAELAEKLRAARKEGATLAQLAEASGKTKQSIRVLSGEATWR